MLPSIARIPADERVLLTLSQFGETIRLEFGDFVLAQIDRADLSATTNGLLDRLFAAADDVAAAARDELAKITEAGNGQVDS